jgi:hypothetical protein
MRKEIACLLIVVAVLFGFFLGREFPRHHYQPLGNGWVILDTSTGKTCDLRTAAPPAPLSDTQVFGKDFKYATPSGLPYCGQ